SHPRGGGAGRGGAGGGDVRRGAGVLVHHHRERGHQLRGQPVLPLHRVEGESAMIRVTDVTKRYGDFVAVDSASVEIEPRTITSFVGPNGAGKSTLLGIISRLIPKDSGSVHVDGTEVSAWKTHELAKKISILKQTNHI